MVTATVSICTSETVPSNDDTKRSLRLPLHLTWRKTSDRPSWAMPSSSRKPSTTETPVRPSSWLISKAGTTSSRSTLVFRSNTPSRVRLRLHRSDSCLTFVRRGNHRYRHCRRSNSDCSRCDLGVFGTDSGEHHATWIRHSVSNYDRRRRGWLPARYWKDRGLSKCRWKWCTIGCQFRFRWCPNHCEDLLPLQQGEKLNAHVQPHYDSLLVKCTVRGTTYEVARRKMLRALVEFRIRGVKVGTTSCGWLRVTDTLRTARPTFLS